ncbi:hypothetical protein [Paenibacillus silvae]|uniref:hypothetical protein n=1 Tax=Paenibacillus silvae TaxID=1325358 RepID=UPI00200667A4|nr:hypothetical protein [Paenibacillus silvae]MCK6078510.1 hypothetical protein [Paenibacillus silvae]MCK6152830.1 hypothetical protein [Paenibacillus silvae]MCK6271282.1 hypothetical protein [Paenibacillus silvae]
MKNMILNIVLSFLTGLLAYYMVTKTITMAAVWACLAAAGIVALGYFVVYTLKKKIKKS